MFVLGVDPGLTRCGYGCIEQPEGRGGRTPRAVALGVLRTDKDDPLPKRLADLQLGIRALIREFQPAVVAVERVFFQANVRTAMAVGQASGIVMAEAHAAGCQVEMYTPNQVKDAVAGHGSADKEQVGQMVQTLLGLSAPPKPADAADAAALALCHLAHAPMRDRVRA
jgi:crossover junction endodeoxyribonuclease RuvC